VVTDAMAQALRESELTRSIAATHGLSITDTAQHNSYEFASSLMPKSVSTWHSCEDEFQRVFDDFDAILQPPALPNPNSFPPLIEFKTEADLEGWLRTTYVSDVHIMLEQALHNLKMQAPHTAAAVNPLNHARVEHDAPNTRLAQQLCSIRIFSIMMQRNDTPAVTFAGNATRVASILRDNRELRQSLGVMPPRTKALLKARSKQSRTDIELIYRSNNSREREDKTCLIIECQNPSSFTEEVVREVIEHWNDLISIDSPGARDAIASFPQHDIPLRLLLAGQIKFPQEVKYVFSCLVQLYHCMVVRCQKYGLLTSGVTSVMMQVDWEHPNEPGQHVKIRQVTEDGAAFPAWGDRNARPILPYVIFCLTLLQIEQGPVNDELLERVVDDCLEAVTEVRTHITTTDTVDGQDAATAADEPQDADYEHPDGSAGDTYRSLDDDAHYDASHLPLHGNQGARIPSHELPASLSCDATIETQAQAVCLQSLLEKVHRDKDKEALVAFFAPVEPKLCRIAPPADLIYVASRIARKFDSGKGVDSSEIDLMHPRGLIHGPVPPELNRRLAEADRIAFTSNNLAHGEDGRRESDPKHRLNGVGSLPALVRPMSTQSTLTFTKNGHGAVTADQSSVMNLLDPNLSTARRAQRSNGSQAPSTSSELQASVSGLT